MGQRKNKTTKKQRKFLQNNLIIGDQDPDFGQIHYTDFVCSHCGTHENIPTHIVMEFEFRDHDLPNYMPSFYCEKCNHPMYPTYFKGYTGKVYEYKLKG